jgi:hypothetical protein
MKETCTRCGRSVPGYEGVFRSGEGRDLGFHCGRCWSSLIAERAGEDVGHLEIEPITMRDAAGGEHTFHFRFIPAPRGIEAFELVDGTPGGYTFQVLQEDEEPRLVELLLERMRRDLARQHLKPCDLRRGKQRIRDMVVRGRIEWDEDEDGRVPLLVVDGKTLTWDELGEMLMSFEGWQFRLEILDVSEEW